MRVLVVDDQTFVAELVKLALEVGLQTGAVVALEGSQLVDLLLQHVTLSSELVQHRRLPLLSLGDHPGRALARLGDHLLMARGCFADELVVLCLTGGRELLVPGLRRREKLFLFGRGLTNNLVVVCLRLADQALASVLALGHILVVELLRQREYAGRRGRSCGSGHL